MLAAARSLNFELKFHLVEASDTQTHARRRFKPVKRAFARAMYDHDTIIQSLSKGLCSQHRQIRLKTRATIAKMSVSYNNFNVFNRAFRGTTVCEFFPGTQKPASGLRVRVMARCLVEVEMG